MSRLLIVEDEEVLADSLQDILKNEGHQVFTVHDGKAAVEAFLRERPDLVLLDLMLPRLDGASVLERLRRDQPTAAVLILTTSSREALRGQSVQGFLQKPFSLEALLEAVRSALPASTPPAS
jgi:DNA-binding response OmpR family regulator